VAGVQVTGKVIMVAVTVVAALWFIFVNTQRVSIYLWVPKVTAPLWLVLVITFAVGLVTGLLLQRRGGRSAR
jgi:Lipopolysaccharide assembly protein A domain